MRCLYCGKEQALLKRWTSGGEFCSESHRQQYQDEYNQLGLNRLLQVKPANVEQKPAVKSKPPGVADQIKPEPKPVAETRTDEKKDLARAPAGPMGFLVELPVPAMVEILSMAKPETSSEPRAAPSLPSHAFGSRSTDVVAAGRVGFELYSRVLDSAARPTERRLEAREFVRSTPVVEIDRYGASGAGLRETSKELMEILIFPHPPQGSPVLWQEAAKEFDRIELELGAFARVVFAPTGFEDDKDGAPRIRPVSQPHAGVIVQEQFAPAAPFVARPDLVPDRATKPLPLTFHGRAAGKGKPVQVFSSAVSSGIDVQIPRSSALPLRPAMTLGPAPSMPGKTAAKSDERKPAERPVVKPDPKKQQPTRPDPRFANSKGRKPEVTIPEAGKKELEKRIPETKTATVSRSSILKETEPLNPPVSVPYIASDLGLPSLSMEVSSGFWRKLPVAAKIGMAAALALMMGGVIELGMRGTGATATRVAHVMEAGPPLPATDYGWITDWRVDSGVRRHRQISLLRQTMNLTDYRMELQGQIDTKAIGWVFRAMDPKNFYVMKLEIVKPGLEPTVALVRFAVIQGEELPHTQVPLTMPVRLDTLYKIRFEAVRNHFTTWVQDQKIDEWTDDQIKKGGAGLFSERGERASLRGSLNVVPLVIGK